MTYDSMLVHCCVMFAVMGGIALLLFRRGHFCPTRSGFWVWLSLFLCLGFNPATTLMFGQIASYRKFTAGSDITTERVYWILFNIVVGLTAFFAVYLRARPASIRQVPARIPSSLALAACAPFLLLGFRGILLYHAGATDSQVEIISGHFVGSVTGWEYGSTNFVIYPCLLFMCVRPLRVLGIGLGALFLIVRLRHDTSARFSMVVLPLAMLLYMTIRKGRRWPSMPAAGLIAALVALLVARGHSALGDMSSQERTISAVGRRAAELIARGDDTALLPSLYRYSDLVNKVGFSYGLNTVQYIVFGPLPRKYFPWKSEVFDSVPGVRVEVKMPEELYGAKPSMLGAFYLLYGALGVVAGMVFLGFVLRKMDGLLEKSVAPHVLVWAAMLLATVWMGILGNVEWWYQEAMMMSAPFFVLVALDRARRTLLGLSEDDLAWGTQRWSQEVAPPTGTVVRQ